MELSGKTVIVTGGFGALGAVVAEAVAASGARVALVDRVPAPPVSLMERLGANAAAFGGRDLTDPEDAKRTIDEAAANGLHGLVNIAGGFRWETLKDGDIATWDFLYRLNLKSAVCACKAALPHLKEGGRIVNIGAGAAAKAGLGMGAYAASKAGVAKLTEALSEELKGHGITVNALLPSIIDTPANRADMPKADFSKWVTPQAIADVILFLLSEKSRAITGASIPVPGQV